MWHGALPQSICVRAIALRVRIEGLQCHCRAADIALRGKRDDGRDRCCQPIGKGGIPGMPERRGALQCISEPKLSAGKGETFDVGLSNSNGSFVWDRDEVSEYGEGTS
jgi:hypothetical protein